MMSLSNSHYNIEKNVDRECFREREQGNKINNSFEITIKLDIMTFKKKSTPRL